MDLTIVIPSYNHSSSVVECVLALDHNEAEIIVVDDGSTQPVVLPSSTASVIRHERHRGRAAALNTGLDAATHDLVLVIDDEIYAAPDLVEQLIEEFAALDNPMVALAGRVVWDPDVPLTLTMRWLEGTGKFPAPTLLWRPFVLEHGGYDENFTRGLEDVELELRLKQHGLESRRLESAVGFQNRVIRVRDFVEREFTSGLAAVYLHSKFPAYVPQVDDMEALLRNEKHAGDAEAAVSEIALLEQADSDTLPSGASDLFAHVCRHYFLHGVFEGLRDIGGIKQRRGDSSTLAIYNHASRLEEMGELDEARRLFRLVLHRPDQEYWNGSEYHLGCIESALGNESAAHSHFIECIRLNPGHNEARRALNRPSLYREVSSNVFEIIGPPMPTKVLFVLFGDLGDVINAFPVVAALREKFAAETVWLTSPKYAALVRASFADGVREADIRGLIPWDWIHSEGFTHVFCPEGEANKEEWEASGLHRIDFMALKCGVTLETHRTWLEPGPEALYEAEEFLKQHGLRRGEFVAASHVGATSRHWPLSNLVKLATEIDMPTVVFGEKTDPAVPGTISCFGKPFQVVAALIGWSSFYVGPDSGISWIATTTRTPMGVFMDPTQRSAIKAGFRDVLLAEKHDIEEWGIYTSPETVIQHVRSTVLIGEPQ